MTSSAASDDTSVTSQLVHNDLHFTRNRIKLAVLGERGTGKSSVIRRFKWDVFVADAPEMEAHQVLTKIIHGDSYKIELMECDAESLLVDDSIEEAERVTYRNIRDWVDLHGVLVLYDTTQEGSFDRAIDYAKIMARALPPSCDISMVGTKCDLKESRKTSFNHADAVSERLELSLFELSAKTSINCGVCLDEIVERIVERRGPNVESYVTESVYPTDDHSPHEEPQPIHRGILPSIFCFKWWNR